MKNLKKEKLTLWLRIIGLFIIFAFLFYAGYVKCAHAQEGDTDFGNGYYDDFATEPNNTDTSMLDERNYNFEPAYPDTSALVDTADASTLNAAETDVGPEINFTAPENSTENSVAVDDNQNLQGIDFNNLNNLDTSYPFSTEEQTS